MIPHIITRSTAVDVAQLAQSLSLSPLQARLLAHRMSPVDQDSILELEKVVNASLANIPAPHLLKDSHKAVKRIALAIEQKQLIGLLTDYDVDGITSHAILFFALKHYFHFPEANIQHLIGHRINDGYGVSQGLVDKILSAEVKPDLIITADCGSSDEQQIAQLKGAGIDVIVTDHHAIPLDGIPQSAYATINPTRDDCDYPDHTIAGCMVSWLLMSQLRAELISNYHLGNNTVKLSGLLDFVSLGTVADAVSLVSPVNRAVVKAGLKIMNQLKRPCWQSIKQLLERDFQEFTAEDLGFQIGPRINARSRMSDPYMALHYLCADSLTDSMTHLRALDQDNQERKQTEKAMLDTAIKVAKDKLHQYNWTLVIFHESFHAGVQGIVASRLIEKFGRPVVVLSPSNETGKLTGSARTITDIHIRDAIEAVAKQSDNIVLGFGGHKGAAGLKLNEAQLDKFCDLFDQAVESQLSSVDTLKPIIYTDGELQESEMSFQTIAEIKQLEPYGREFDVPIFEGDFLVQSIRSIGSEGTHLMLQLATESYSFRAVWFRALETNKDPFPFVEGQLIHAVYQLKENYYRGNFSIQLHIVYASI